MTMRDWEIGKIFGIPIKVHASWFVVFAFLTWNLATGYLPDVLPGLSNLRYWGMGMVAALLLFLSVLLHELGHSYVALRYRVPISEITLFIFGGMAQMRREPPGPRAEFLIAIAGPIVSLALAGVLFSFVLVSSSAQGLDGLVALGGLLGSINLSLGVFNMIPGFPLDGGRVLRAGLWAWSGDFYQATRSASLIGQGFGLALGLLGAGLVLGGLSGLVGGPVAGNGGWILLIGIFLFVVARSSRRQAALRASLAGLSVDEVMVRHVITLEGELTVEEAVAGYVLPHGYRGFPVVEAGRLIGMVTLAELQALPQVLWPLRKVRDIMQPWSSTLEVPSDASALEALERMIHTGEDRLVVVSRDRVVGLVTRSGISHALQLHGPPVVPSKIDG